MVVSGMVIALCIVAAWTYAAYDSANGQVKSVDVAGNKIVVSVRTGFGPDATSKDQTFLVDKDTTVRINREVKTLADLKADMRVNITFKEVDKGDPTALLISAMQGRPGGGGGGGGRGGAGGGAGGGGN